MHTDEQNQNRKIRLVQNNNQPERNPKLVMGRLGKRREFERKFRVISRDATFVSKLDRNARDLAEGLNTLYWSLVCLYGYDVKALIQLAPPPDDDLLAIAADILCERKLKLEWREVRDLGVVRFSISRLISR